MRTYLLAGIMCLACYSFTGNSDSSVYSKGDKNVVVTFKPNVFDVTVHRLSGDRVMISWHAEGESPQTRFEVMRKHGREIFTSVGTVEQKTTEEISADYSFIDVNVFEDSSFYCVKKTEPDSVVFFSISRGIEGVGKERW